MKGQRENKLVTPVFSDVHFTMEWTSVCTGTFLSFYRENFDSLAYINDELLDHPN